MGIDRSSQSTEMKKVREALYTMRHKFSVKDVSGVAGVPPHTALTCMRKIRDEIADKARGAGLVEVGGRGVNSIWEFGSKFNIPKDIAMPDVKRAVCSIDGEWRVSDVVRICGVSSLTAGLAVNKMARNGEVKRVRRDGHAYIYRTTISEPKPSVTLPDPVAPPLHRFNDLTGAERQAIEHATACWTNLMQSAKDLLEEARRLADKAQPFLDEAAEWRSVVESLGGRIDPNYAD